ncbi:MAG: anti-sigma factor [Flavobacteriaceae bacterium]|nr:anti-sigma factor [Flavobacteriaceae bacterium]
MMNSDYIEENNLLEQFVLGNLNAEEQVVVERAVMNDPALKKKLHSIEETFEQLAKENAVSPPPIVKEQLFGQIRTKKSKVIPLADSSVKRIYFYAASAVAACLLLGSFWMYTQWSETTQQLEIVQQTNEQLIEDVNILTTNMDATTDLVAMINSPETEQYILEGNDLAPDAKIISYINHTNKAVVINAKKLPPLSEDEDYQMWADVDGEMIDMGLIIKDTPILAMNYIDSAESLNITIEPAGGSDHPTVSRLISNVYLR